MSITFWTITQNGMPFIQHHLPVFSALKVPFHWIIVHGPAANVNCTSWCKKQPEGVSTDGTTEYLREIASHPNVTVIEKPWWEGGKVQMMNAAVAETEASCVAMQIDGDEFWYSEQLEDIARLFVINSKLAWMKFRCSYFVGPKLVLSGDDSKNSWLRAWRYRKGMRFDSHEPPVLSGNKGEGIEACMTEAMGLRFDHMAWCSEEQVRFKAEFYGYTGGLTGWKALQEHKKFPVEARHYLTWMIEGTMVNKLP
jgi:hypothetical protein